MRKRLPPVLRERDYTRLLAVSVAVGFGQQMVFVAVGWQVYDISRNPFHLGLVGLAEFLPLLLFALPAGAIADRFPRKLILIASVIADAVITTLLLFVSLSGANSLWQFLGSGVRERHVGRARSSGDALDVAEPRSDRNADEGARASLDRFSGDCGDGARDRGRALRDPARSAPTLPALC